jgi:hypothetical protein
MGMGRYPKASIMHGTLSCEWIIAVRTRGFMKRGDWVGMEREGGGLFY